MIYLLIDEHGVSLGLKIGNKMEYRSLGDLNIDPAFVLALMDEVKSGVNLYKTAHCKLCNAKVNIEWADCHADMRVFKCTRRCDNDNQYGKYHGSFHEFDQYISMIQNNPIDSKLTVLLSRTTLKPYYRVFEWKNVWPDFITGKHNQKYWEQTWKIPLARQIYERAKADYIRVLCAEKFYEGEEVEL